MKLSRTSAENEKEVESDRSKNVVAVLSRGR
jgi:hypothetical protein